ncbi:sel1 repeat family protein [bacterium]|nr:sel1 repeat family protein [bacterium]
MRHFFLSVISALFLTSSVIAEEFEKGFTAYKNGDYETARDLWSPLADQGDGRAQTNLGLMYEHGKGVPKNHKEAIKWYTLAAEQGYSRAQESLGVMYEYGKGVPKNNEKAIKWYLLAAEQGVEQVKPSLENLFQLLTSETFSKNQQRYGCFEIIELFEKTKEFVESDENRYIEFCQNFKFAIDGNSDSQFKLGKHFLDGDLVHQDYKKAMKWFRFSAVQENKNAQRNLGLMYARGTGVSKNEKAALNWYLAAAKQGDEVAGELAADLLLRDIVYGNTVDRLYNLAALINGCFLVKDARCAFDKVWKYLDVSEDDNLSLAELSKFQRDLIKFSYVEGMKDAVEIEEVAAINLSTILLLPITSSSILHSFDYNNNGTLQKEEVFGETEFAKLVGIDAQSLISGVEFQTLGNKINDAIKKLPLPF